MFKLLAERYLVLIVFVGVWIVGLAIRYLLGGESWLWGLWESIDVAFAVALGLMAFLAYRDFIKSEDEIKLYFKIQSTLEDTGLSLLRKDCTRSELLGVLGMIQKETTQRYSIAYMKNRELLQSLHRIQKGEEDRLVIVLSSDELKQFDTA